MNKYKKLVSVMENKKFIWVLIGLILLTNVFIYFNIPFLRQLTGFVFLTILPGLLMLWILRLNKLGLIEKLTLSVGLSISFLMFLGLFFNNLSVSFGLESPLSTTPLLIFFGFVVITMGIVVHKMNINKKTVLHVPSKLDTSEIGLLIVLLIFLSMSIFGSHFMNSYNNNSIILVLIFGISIFTIFICVFNNKIPPRIYPVVIFFIGLSLILLKALRSYHIIGIDAHEEYYIFQTILNNKQWSILRHNALDACLSISLLPTIYQTYLNVNPEIFMNVFYVLLFSLTPIIVFLISKKYIGDFYAFLASLFFMFQARFIFSAGGARTNLAILFFALAMMVIFSDKIEPVNKRILFIIFTASCIVSHYSTAYIYFFVLLATLIGISILIRKKYNFKRTITLNGIILFFSIIFVWYSQATKYAFDASIHFIGNTLKYLQTFFVIESRGQVQALVGQGIAEKGLPHKIEFIFTWLIFVLIAIGILSIIKNYREMVVLPELNYKKKFYLKEKFEVEYFLIALACCILLVIMVVFPYIAVGYAMDRLYCMTSIILSVFFVIGCIVTMNFLFFVKARFFDKKYKPQNNDIIKKGVYIGILIVLVPYFMCISGVTYQFMGYPRQIILNAEGEQADILVHDQESYAANWLSKFRNEQTIIFADFYGQRRLVSQGQIAPEIISHDWFSAKTKLNGYTYLTQSNIKKGKLRAYHSDHYDMADYIDILNKQNGIYDSGYSRVLR